VRSATSGCFRARLQQRDRHLEGLCVRCRSLPARRRAAASTAWRVPLATTLTEARLLDFRVEVLNVPGDGARRAWTHCVENYPGRWPCHRHQLAEPDQRLSGRHRELRAHPLHADRHAGDGIHRVSRCAPTPRSRPADLLSLLGRDPASVTIALSLHRVGQSQSCGARQADATRRW